MRLAKVQLIRAVTINGLLGTRDFITADDALLNIDGEMLTIETVLGGLTLVPIQNVLYMNALPAPKKDTATPSATTKTEDTKQDSAQSTPRGSSTGKRSSQPR